MMRERMIVGVLGSVQHSKLVCVTMTAGLMLLAGCATKQKQLESVAKDWCMTIRASQVIPVYPLTQDIQPGDVFLVQLPVDKQQQQYREKGFLPLDNHLARLTIDSYDEFYADSFLGKPGEAAMKLPMDWMRPSGAPGQNVKAWSMAPGAAFPTYTFSVSSSAGLNLAVPISGVPVGLSLLGADSANGSVTIDDAKTLGVDIMSLHDSLLNWINANASRREFLAAYGTPAHLPPRNFLRVISRVYLTGELAVSLNDAEMRGGGADVGMPRPVASMTARAPDGTQDVAAANRQNYELAIAQLNRMLAERDTPVSSSAGVSSSETGAEAEAAAAEARRYREARVAEAQKRLEDAKKSDDNTKPIEDEAAARKASEQAAKEEGDARAELILAIESGNETKVKEAKEKAKDAVTKLAAARTTHDATRPAAAAAAARIDAAQQSLDALKNFTPGGSFRFTAASSRSVSMKETFDPPLVIGYLAFDVAVFEDGQLGAPIPTHALLNGYRIEGAQATVAAIGKLTEAGKGAASEVFEALQIEAQTGDAEAAHAVASLNLFAQYIPDRYSVFVNTGETMQETVRERKHSANYLSFKSFRASLDPSRQALDHAKQTNQRVTWHDGTSQSGDAARQRLETEASLIESRLQQLRVWNEQEQTAAQKATLLYLKRVREGRIPVELQSP